MDTLAAPPAEARIALNSAHGRWIIAATALGSGMIFLDGTVVNVALPRIQSDLAAPLAGLQWIVNAYTLFLAALLLPGGGLGDIYGRKLGFLSGLVVFTLASVGCGLAPNLGVLIAARAIQGVGGALLVPGSLAMIKAVIAPEDNGRAIGLWAGLSGVTTAIGPLVGGYLVSAVTWRAIFFINVPIAVVTFYATAAHVPANRDEQASRDLDWPGALAIIAGLGGLTYALIEGPAARRGDPIVLAAIAVGILGVLLFPLREARARHPMVPLDIFRSRNFSGANLATVGVYFSLGGALLFLVLDLQQIQGYSPLESGIALLPVTALLLLLSPRMGTLTGRFGPRFFMTVGPVVVALAFVLFLTAGRHLSYPINILPGVIVLGLGMSIFITPLTTTVMNSVSDNLAGIASGVSNTLTRVASLLAVAVLGLIIVTRFGSVLDSKLTHVSIPPSVHHALLANVDRLANDPLPANLSPRQQAAVHNAIADSFVDGFHWAMATCALLCLLSAGISFATIRQEKPHSSES